MDQIPVTQKIVYQYDSSGFYVGDTIAELDPVVPGNWLLPAGCTETKPPIFTAGKLPKWVGYKWKLISP
ncbi:MAG: hypothetical protein ACTMIS_04775 [Pseudomonas putida]|uniref:hypothetical protein n=1 Tax=Pseudomonas putida TaxID=303 RepID=UPI000AB72BA1|nr:hypothetical protein [Pseudomonas putida]MDD2116770.1 hypothetical protein [Pseudomonas putida]UPU94092.1 hypothetical protein M0766_06815 [Pseudomonas putida]WQE51580.1 hypothetical protein U0028_16985 [Pseudomonas putida]GLO03286.1 hypothetical protein PPUJ13061_31840 [Pseudomonas putida]HDS1005806.1 hypothetical protein [Pseudomonas putida]